jgi:anti-sigma factor RsiW
MPVTDDQLELLEAYIDGELPAVEEDAVRRRLEAEPALLQALDALRGEREVRAGVWRSYEPSDATVRRVVMRIEQKVDSSAIWAHRLSRWRVPLATAACILIGFGIGWIGRGSGGPTTLTPIATGNATGPTVASVPNNPTVTPGGVVTPGNGFQTVSAGASNAAPADGPVELSVVDEYGRPVGVQRFRSRAEAQQFIDDIQRWQRTQEQIRQQGPIAPVSKEKF